MLPWFKRTPTLFFEKDKIHGTCCMHWNLNFNRTVCRPDTRWTVLYCEQWKIHYCARLRLNSGSGVLPSCILMFVLPRPMHASSQHTSVEPNASWFNDRSWRILLVWLNIHTSSQLSILHVRTQAELIPVSIFVFRFPGCLLPNTVCVIMCISFILEIAGLPMSHLGNQDACVQHGEQKHTKSKTTQCQRHSHWHLKFCNGWNRMKQGQQRHWQELQQLSATAKDGHETLPLDQIWDGRFGNISV